MKPQKNTRSIRIWVQVFFFALIGLLSVNNTLVEGGNGLSALPYASLHALCPFGGVVTLYNMFTLGTFVKKIHMSSVILLGIIAALSILFGPVFCGWVCPLGSFQEWLGSIGKKLFKKRYNRFIPEKVDRILRYLRYLILAWVVYVTAMSGYLIFQSYDPYSALFSFWSGEVALSALVVLGVTMLFSLFIERPWCKYACPLGALLGLSNLLRIFKVRRNPATCVNCHLCDRSCPMNISVSSKLAINDVSCISCLECTSEKACPVPDTVNLQTGNHPAVADIAKEEKS